MKCQLSSADRNGPFESRLSRIGIRRRNLLLPHQSGNRSLYAGACPHNSTRADNFIRSPAPVHGIGSRAANSLNFFRRSIFLLTADLCRFAAGFAVTITVVVIDNNSCRGNRVFLVHNNRTRCRAICRARSRTIFRARCRTRCRTRFRAIYRTGWSRRHWTPFEIRSPCRRHRTVAMTAPDPGSVIPIPILITGNPGPPPPVITIFGDHHGCRSCNHYLSRSYHIALLRREQNIIQIAEKHIDPTGIGSMIDTASRHMGIVAGASGKDAPC